MGNMVKMILFTGLYFIFSSCDDDSMSVKIGSIEDEVAESAHCSHYLSEFCFDGNLHDWINLNEHVENSFYYINLDEKYGEDTIGDVFIEHEFGNYNIVSTKYPTTVILPLLYTDSLDELSNKIYDKRSIKFDKQVKFLRIFKKWVLN